MDNLVRREIIADARTLVIKIGTNVLSRDDDTLDVDRISQIAEQIHRVRQTGPASRPGFQRRHRGRNRPVRPQTASERPAPPAGRRRHRSGLLNSSLRRLPAQARLPRGPTPAHRQRLQEPHAVSQRPQHAAHAVRIQSGPDRQRKRHGERGRNQVRRQRPTGRHGHRPVARAAADYSVRRRRTLQRRSQIARQQNHSARRRMERFAPGTRQPHPQPAGHRRHAIQARGRPHGHQRGRKRDHRQRHPAQRHRRNHGRQGSRHPFFGQGQGSARPGSAGSASPSAPKAASSSTTVPARRSKNRANRCWPSASPPSKATSPKAKSSPSSTAAETSSPAASPTTTPTTPAPSPANGPKKSSRPSAACPTRKSSTATTSWSRPEFFVSTSRSLLSLTNFCTLFWLFWGAQKGDFFGVHPKKVHMQNRSQLSCRTKQRLEALHGVQLASRRRSPGQVSGPQGSTQKAGLFWAPPQKTFRPMAEAKDSAPPPRQSPKNPPPDFFRRHEKNCQSDLREAGSAR